MKSRKREKEIVDLGLKKIPWENTRPYLRIVMLDLSLNEIDAGRHTMVVDNSLLVQM